MTPEVEAAADREEAAAKAEAARPVSGLLAEHENLVAAREAADRAAREAAKAVEDSLGRICTKLGFSRGGGRFPGAPVPTVLRNGRLHVVSPSYDRSYGGVTGFTLTPIDMLS